MSNYDEKSNSSGDGKEEKEMEEIDKNDEVRERDNKPPVLFLYGLNDEQNKEYFEQYFKPYDGMKDIIYIDSVGHAYVEFFQNDKCLTAFRDIDKIEGKTFAITIPRRGKSNPMRDTDRNRVSPFHFKNSPQNNQTRVRDDRKRKMDEYPSESKRRRTDIQYTNEYRRYSDIPVKSYGQGRDFPDEYSMKKREFYDSRDKEFYHNDLRRRSSYHQIPSEHEGRPHYEGNFQEHQRKGDNYRGHDQERSMGFINNLRRWE